MKTSLRGPSGAPFFGGCGGYLKTPDLRNGLPMMLMMLASWACIISIIGAPFLQFGGIRLQPLCFLVCFVRAFGWRQTKNDHIWPKPMVLGSEPWFWARCGHVWCKPFQKQPKMTSSGPDLGSGPENLGLGQMWPSWAFWEGTQENMLPALPAPGRSPSNKSRIVNMVLVVIICSNGNNGNYGNHIVLQHHPGINTGGATGFCCA